MDRVVGTAASPAPSLPQGGLGVRALSSLRRAGLTPALTLFLCALLAGPFVMYSALIHHAENEALKDARAFSGVISIVRSYYAANVSARLLSAPAHASVTERYRDIPGAVPIPATLSIELAEKIRAEAIDQSLRFDFVSDAPFRNRARPPLSEFQSDALRAFRLQQTSVDYWRVEDDAVGSPRMRLAIPVKMEGGCVACHNTHPDSPVRNWQVGDVRGIQEVSVDLAIVDQADQSGLLGGYMLFFLLSGTLAVAESRRNNSRPGVLEKGVGKARTRPDEDHRRTRDQDQRARQGALRHLHRRAGHACAAHGLCQCSLLRPDRLRRTRGTGLRPASAAGSPDFGGFDRPG
jgi:hypothetical protein